MRAIDLYAITREIPEELRGAFEKNLSQRPGRLRVKGQEFDQIRAIVEELQRAGAKRECYEDWFYSFTIPHISREFDLLKVGRNECAVNLELKTASPSVTLSRVKKQLQRNAYYLSLIAKKIYGFTYVGDGKGGGQLYALKDGNLKKCSVRELMNKLSKVKNPVKEQIEEMFHPGEYLISPFSEPERFCENQYFLTEHQQMMKERIVSGIRRSRAGLWGITGEAGTGKTLLLYDIAKNLATGYSVCVIHCGKLSEGHQKLRKSLKGIDIIEAEDMAPAADRSQSEREDLGSVVSATEQGQSGREDLGSLKSAEISGYDVVCVDETQRIREEELREIVGAYTAGKIKACIFVYDLKQVLSRSELARNNPEKLRQMNGFTELSLTKTIRTSKEIYAFINALMDLHKRSNQVFTGIDLLYAGNAEETEWLLDNYARKGYRFISMPVDETDLKSGANRFYREDCENSHDVIGLEFDAVSVVLDGRFWYNASGQLMGAEGQGEDYLYVQMLYQNLSRAKEKLCVIVQGNEEVFRELLKVME